VDFRIANFCKEKIKKNSALLWRTLPLEEKPRCGLAVAAVGLEKPSRDLV